MKNEATFLGVVRRVVGAKVYVEVSKDLPSTSPIVNGRVYRLGQIGSFVRIPLGFVNVYGIVSMVGAVEAVGDEELGQLGQRGQRTLEVQLVGETQGTGAFQRGLSIYPTLDDEVHVVTQDDLAHIYAPLNSDQVAIGTHSSSESLRATVDLDKLVTRHTAVLGSTGSGKSNTVAALLKALTAGKYPNARIVVIDPHGEYGAAFEGISRVFRIGDPKTPLVLPYWALSFDELAWFLVDRKSVAESMQDANLRDQIFEMRQASAPTLKASPAGHAVSAEEITVDSPIPFDLRALWYHFDRKERVTYTDMARNKEAIVAEGNAKTLKSASFHPPGAGSSAPFKSAPPPVMGTYVNKLLARLKDRRFDFLLNPGEFDGVKNDLNDLVRQWIDHDHAITVLDLAGVPSEIIDLVVGLLARILFETMFWGRKLKGIGRNRPLLMVFEEAHAYLPSGEGRFLQGYARRTVQRILKEGRKYGVGAVVVSQRPSELDETILSQCGTFVALRLTNGSDQGRVKNTIPDELTGLINLLPVLRTGEALVLGEAMQMPSRVRIYLADPRPDSMDPEVSKRWAEQKTPTDYGAAVTAWRKQRIE